jgi:threonine dehydratase
MLPPLNNIPTKTDLEETFSALSGMVTKTPVITSMTLDSLTGAKVFLKAENFQKVGAFKYRGGCSAILRLTDEQKKNGVAAHSSGNHAQAVALAARNMGVKSYIVMPKDAPLVKKDATRGYGAKIIECESTIEARETTLAEVVRKTGATEIHPYNYYPVIAGQATASMELMDEVSDLDFILAPIGGGGLISGTCLAAKYFSPKTKVIGAEPTEVNEALLSLKKGELVKNKSLNTLADGLRTNIGEKNFEIVKNEIHDILEVSEKEMMDAMKWVWERMKIIIEPSSAVPVAALLKYDKMFNGKRVGIIITGGNVELKEIVSKL